MVFFVLTGVGLSIGAGWLYGALKEPAPQPAGPSPPISVNQEETTTDPAAGEQKNTDGNIVQAIATNITRFFNGGYTTPGAGAGGSGQQESQAPQVPFKLIGTNISGLEFSGLFQANSEPTYAYFQGKGFNAVRLPFDWNELQPMVNGPLDSSAKQYLDENIAWAKQHNLSVILDAHNYGRRQVYRDGGFSDDFAGGTQHTFQLPYGDQDSTEGTLTLRDFGRASAGTPSNPVAPAESYKVDVSARINSASGDLWNELFIDTYYLDDDNCYRLAINPITHTWTLRQYVSGNETTLASGSKTWNYGQYYNFEFDISQATAGKLNISVDGVGLFTTDSVNTTAALTGGRVSLFPSGVNATIKDFTLNVAGDTTSGGPAERRLTDPDLPLSAWEDFWAKLSQVYKNEPTVVAYDHNEPHDMPISTTPGNYSAAAAAANGVPLATVTAAAQAMTNAVRATGDSKYIVVNMDHWANTHKFNDQYGANPQPWVIDSLSPQKIVYSGHYYFDDDHSGSYADPVPPSAEAVSAEVEPFFQWCQAKDVHCYIGEFGVPNSVEWQPILAHFLDVMDRYDIWWTQWAGGDLYSSVTTLQPTSSYTIDRLQMSTISEFLSP